MPNGAKSRKRDQGQEFYVLFKDAHLWARKKIKGGAQPSFQNKAI